LEVGQRQLEEGQIKLHLDVIDVKNGQRKITKEFNTKYG
jgi:hypothetical protein